MSIRKSRQEIHDYYIGILRGWTTQIKQLNKAIRRKNKLINRLRKPSSAPACYKLPVFEVGQIVLHVKTGSEYQISDLPSETALLEYCREPFYKYIKDGIEWTRRQSEMEDGRFKAL